MNLPVATQNVTLRLKRDIVRKAKLLAARRGTSISSLLSGHVEALVAAEDGYEVARRNAEHLFEKGFHLGGRGVDRESLHER